MAAPNVDLRARWAPASPEQIVAARRRVARAGPASGSALLFVLTWLILVGGLVLAIASTGRIDAGSSEWAPFILGGIPITIVVSVCSIFFATIFAVIGALGRLSTDRPDLRRSRPSTSRSCGARR